LSSGTAANGKAGLPGGVVIQALSHWPLSGYWFWGRGVVRKCVLAGVVAVALAGAQQAFAADIILATKAPPPSTPPAPDWTGWYVGGHLGYAWGNSNFSGPAGVSGSLGLFQPFDAFQSTGSYFEGLQAGYNYMFADRVVIGAEADASFPSFQNNAGISIGGSTTFASPSGLETYSETALSSGTVRGRIGYAPGHWLLYATGGFAWSYDRLTLTNSVTGTTDMPFLWRLGWAAGAGFEVPVATHWTARLEYLYTDCCSRPRQRQFRRRVHISLAGLSRFPIAIRGHQ
jgi:high affinity Mn2+ porin